MQRAEQLAARGSGDLLIADDLERQGVPPELARLAIDGARAGGGPGRRDRRGTGLSPKTARYLASRGFSEAALEPLVANLAADGLG